MGLMAVHLLLLAANRVRPDLSGAADIFSDCLGALDKVSSLPANRIPTRCRHSDTLKNIMVNCEDLTFSRRYHHVRAHQDDSVDYLRLPRPAQLNCIVDLHAKREIWRLEGETPPTQEAFPLEPVAVFAGNEKLTSDTAPALRFWAHLRLAEDVFFQLGIMSTHSFREVAWKEAVYPTLHDVPRLFALWACKQVQEVAGTNLQQSQYNDEHDPHCPSCTLSLETCSHVLHCPHAGRVDALRRSIDLFDDWIGRNDTEPGLRRCLRDFARGRGSLLMEEIARSVGARYLALGASQDAIGWRRFMEGMISKEVVAIQAAHLAGGAFRVSLATWARGLVTKLLETTHGQWLYRNVHVHDALQGVHATARKEEIQQFIEDQLERGGDGLDERDHYLLEINLEDLETTSGEEQHYWLLQIQAARCEQALLLAEQGSETSQPQEGERA